MDINKEYKEEIKFIVEQSDKNLPEILREFAEKYHKEQLLIHGVRLMLPDEKELNSLKNQYPASGGDAGWIQDAYKNGYIDGWNRKRTDKHLCKSTKKHRPKGN